MATLTLAPKPARVTGRTAYKVLHQSGTLVLRKPEGPHYPFRLRTCWKKPYIKAHEYRPNPLHLWVVSFASDIETRELQVVLTSWLTKRWPKPHLPGPHSPATVIIRESEIPEWVRRHVH